MRIAAGRSSIGMGGCGRRDKDGTSAGQISFSGTSEKERVLARARARAQERAREAKKAREAKRAKEAKSRQEFKKKIHYNFKQISNRILQAKTSGSARRVVSSARRQVVELRKKLTMSNYDNPALLNAIRHAEAIARVAKKKLNHLLEEENAAQQGGICEAEIDERAQDIPEEAMEDAEVWFGEISETETAPALELEDIRELMEIYQELMQEAMEDVEGLDELDDMLADGWSEEMDPNDLKLMKAKHRSEELRKIMEADMKYLKAVFEQMEKEQQNGVGGAGSSDSSGIGREGAGYAASGVALELGGVEIPVETHMVSAAEVVEGGRIDAYA